MSEVNTKSFGSSRVGSRGRDACINFSAAQQRQKNNTRAPNINRCIQGLRHFAQTRSITLSLNQTSTKHLWGPKTSCTASVRKNFRWDGHSEVNEPPQIFLKELMRKIRKKNGNRVTSFEYKKLLGLTSRWIMPVLKLNRKIRPSTDSINTCARPPKILKVLSYTYEHHQDWQYEQMTTSPKSIKSMNTLITWNESCEINSVPMHLGPSEKIIKSNVFGIPATLLKLL